MSDFLSGGFPVWVEAVVVLALGTTAIVGAGWLICHTNRSTAWQKTTWQIAAISLVVLVIGELTGMSSALVGLSRVWSPGEHSERESLTHVSIPSTDRPSTDRPDWSESISKPLVVGETFGESERAIFDSLELGWVRTGVALAMPVSPVAMHADTGIASAIPSPIPKGDKIDVTSEDLTGVFVDEVVSTPWPVLVWLAIAVVAILRIGVQRIRLIQFCRRCQSVSDDTIISDVAHLAGRLGMKRPVRLLETRSLRIPVSWGVYCPTIILPTGFRDRFDVPEQRAVLAHELAHLAAHDSAWQLTTSFLCGILWWHPGVFLLRRELQTVGELAADDAARLVPDGPELLAACLVLLGRDLAAPQQLGWLSVGGDPIRSGLGRRVKRLLDLPGGSWRPPSKRRLAFAKVLVPTLLVIAIVFSTVWVRAQASFSDLPFADRGTTMSLLSYSWRQSLAATAVVVLLVPFANAEDSAVSATVTVTAEPAGDDNEAAERAERREHREREARELREVRAQAVRAEHRERDDRPEHREPRHEPFEELMQLEMAQFELQIGLHILADDEDEKAENLQRELKEVTNHLREIREHSDGLPPNLAQQVAHRRLEQLEHTIHRMHEAGRHDKALQLEAVMHEIKNALEHGDAPHHREGPEGEQERRLHHIQVAIDNLHAAGLHEMAEKLARESEEISRERRPEHGQHDQPHPEHGQHDRPHPEHAQHDLGGQVEQLRNEVRELRELIRELHERP